MDHDVQQFVEITGASAAVARQMIDAHGGDVNEAVEAFLSGASPATSSASLQDNFGAAPSSSSPASSYSSGPSRPSYSRGGGGSRIRTMADIQREAEEAERQQGGGDDDDDESNEYYAGGDKSGVAIRGPPKQGGGHNSILDSIFKRAEDNARAGVTIPPEELEGGGGSSSSSRRVFAGTAYRLGESADAPSQVIPDESDSAAPPPRTTHRIAFWRNGFVVNDGPLRSYNEPQNAMFLQAIQQERVPDELFDARVTEVNMAIARNLDRDYVEERKPVSAFAGTGHRLGTIIPGEPTPSPAAAPAPTGTVDAPQVDESAPTTSVQIRFADGGRAVAKFNHTHTVGDIVRYIQSTRPGDAVRSFALMTTFPNRTLTDMSATIKDAGLLNAVIVQRYT